MATAPERVAIRRAPEHFADWQAVHGLVLDAFSYMHGRIDPPSSALRLTPESMAADMIQGALLLAEVGDALVGCLFARAKGDALYIGKLAVRPGWQGRGIGRALVEAARAEARASGLAALELQTRIELTEKPSEVCALGLRQDG